MLFKNNFVFSSRNFFLLGIITIVIGLSFSKPLISLGQIILFLTWLFGANIKDRLNAFYHNKTAVFISSIYLLTLFGLLYTNNFDYAIGDVRRKAALFGLPFLIAGFRPISNKEWNVIFKLYVGGVLIASFWSMFVFWGGLEKIVVDVREYSRFNSHIRFGLEICFAIFGTFYLLLKTKNNLNKMIWAIIIIWLIIFLYLTSLFTGIIVFIITTLILSLFFSITSPKNWIKFTSIIGLTCLFIFTTIFINNSIKEYYCENIIPLETKGYTSSGEQYFHDTQSKEKENGYFVWKNIAWKETEAAWNNKSQLPFSGKDLKEQKLATTLIRFLTSKGNYKNAENIDQLSSAEIKAIEKGVANSKYLYMNNIEKRIHNIIWEIDNYQRGGNFNGHSVIMRWEYWKTGYRIFKQNYLLGVGTGDLQDEFDTQYEMDNSTLLPKYRLRAHNQYLTYAISFGLLGVICFTGFLFYPFLKNNLYMNFTYLAFFSIILLSIISEDTLETQIGVNFFALFNTILLLKEKN